MKKAFGIFGILSVIIIASFLDINFQRAKQLTTTTFQPPISTLFWVRIISTIIVAIILLILSWYLLRNIAYGSIETILCVMLGASTLFITTIQGIRFVGQFEFFHSSLFDIWLTDIVSSNLSLTSHSAAFLLCIGIIRLLPNKIKKKMQSI